MPARTGKFPRVYEIVRMTAPMLEALRTRLQAHLEKHAPDELPDKDWVDAFSAYMTGLDKQASTWLKLRDAAKRAAEGLTGRELDKALQRELERFCVEGMSEEQFMRIAAARMGKPVTLVPIGKVVEAGGSTAAGATAAGAPAAAVEQRAIASPQAPEERRESDPPADDADDFADGDPSTW